MKWVIVLLGILEFLFPRALIEHVEPLAFEQPKTAELRPWTLPIARLEGLLFVLLGLTSRLSSIAQLLGPLGVIMALRPERTLAVSLGMAYQNGDEIALKSWVVPVTRLLGAVYVIVAVGAFVARSGRSDRQHERPGPDRRQPTTDRDA